MAVTTLPPIPYTAFGTTFTDAVNAAIGLLNTTAVTADTLNNVRLGDENSIESLAGNVAQLNSEVDTLNSTRLADEKTILGLAANISGLNASITSLSAQGKALQGAIDTLASVTATAAALDSVVSDLAALRITFRLLSRPGDAPDAFTTDLAAGRSGVPTNAAVVVGPNGRALRLPGAFVLAPVALCAVEPNRTYKLRAALRCSTDTTDPAGDAIRFAAAWYDASGNQLASLPLSDLATQRLTVAMGRAVYEAVVSLNPPAAPTDPYVRPVLQVPPGAAYCRPVLIGYGAAPVTDVEVLASADITDSGAVSVDVDSINARVSAIAAALNLSI